MRHSDLKLTMQVYTDASQLPLIAEAARMPSFNLPGVRPAQETYKTAEGQKEQGPTDLSEVNRPFSAPYALSVT